MKILQVAASRIYLAYLCVVEKFIIAQKKRIANSTNHLLCLKNISYNWIYFSGGG